MKGWGRATPSSGYGGCSLTRRASPASPAAESGVPAGSGCSAGPRPPPAAAELKDPSSSGTAPLPGGSCPLSPGSLPGTSARPAGPSRRRGRWKGSLKATKGHPVIPCGGQRGMDSSSAQPRGKRLAAFLLFPQGNDTVSSLQ